MEKSTFEQFREKLIAGWNNLVKKSDEESIAEMGRERIIVFVVSLILAFCLWLMVNLSLVYTLNIDLPISLGVMPEDQALAESLPSSATVSVSGEGWKLINIYNNPPSIDLNVGNSEVNLYDQVQQRMNAMPDISVQKVQPSMLTLDLEERVTKKVPVRSQVDVSFRDQYDFVGTSSLQPDSVTINGAGSLVMGINEWSTDSVQFNDVSQNLSRVVSLQESGELINLSQEEVIYNASVAQYTEGEVKVDITTRDLPDGRSVSFSPSSITVKYDVPINEFTELKGAKIFDAFVTYRQIEEDSSGFVTPQINQLANEYHIKVRSFQPAQVAYFMVLDN